MCVLQYQKDMFVRTHSRNPHGIFCELMLYFKVIFIRSKLSILRYTIKARMVSGNACHIENLVSFWLALKQGNESSSKYLNYRNLNKDAINPYAAGG